MFRARSRCATVATAFVALVMLQTWFPFAPSARTPTPLRVDLVWQSITGALSVWEMDRIERHANGAIVPGQLPDPQWKMVGSGDFNGDGRHDLVWHHQTNGSLAVWFMDGTTMVSGVPLSPGVVADTAWKVRAVGDINNDGHPDLIWQNVTTKYISAWLMNGIQQTSGPLLHPSPLPHEDWHVVGVGHTNGDGLSDLLWHHRTQGHVSTWYMNGIAMQPSGGVALSPATVTPVTWQVRTVGDMDGNGSADLLWHNQTTGVLSAWLMSGVNRTSGEVLDPSTNAGWELATTMESSQVAMPALNIPAGGPYDSVSLTGSTHTAGATLRYTLDGSDPTEASAAFPASLALTQSATVKVKAFKSGGYAPSRTLVADYVLAAAAPVLSHGTNTYTNDLNVTLTTTTANAQIRYTLDGSEPSQSAPASPLYTAPVPVSAGTTLKAKAFRSGLANSATASATYSFQAAAPAFTPTPGTYGAGQTVAIATPTSGATLRYTLDGSDPTQNSDVYGAPLQLPPWVSMTVKAKAFRSGWTASGTTAGAFEIGQDTTAPVVTASVSPMPNTNGWNNSDVTVSFACTDSESGIQSCPVSQVLTQEGAGQVITGTATDRAGNEATASVTVSIDKVAGTVSVNSPATMTTTTASSVVLTGTVNDVLSGVATASCNGALTTPSNGAVNCTVPLQPGSNALVLHILDAAGNGASAGLRVTRTGTPTALSIVPAVRTLLVGETAPLEVVDNFGQPVTGATWTTTDPDVVALQVEASSLLAAAAGQATVTASWQGLSANLAVTVVAGVAMPSATVLWQTTVTAGLVPGATVYANRVDADGPDMFAVENDSAGNAVSIRALTAAGRQLWSEAAPGNPIFGDSYGGIVGIASNRRALVRFGGGAGAAPWRYESPGIVFQHGIAQAPDGTIYAAEATEGFPGSYRDGFIAVIDGSSGALKARVPLPPSSFEAIGPGTCAGRTEVAGGAAPIIGPDGTAFAQRYEYHMTYPCGGAGHTTIEQRLELMNVRADGSHSSVLLVERIFSAPTESEDDPHIFAGKTVPDGLGGIIATYNVGTHLTVYGQRYIKRIVNGSTVAEYPIQDSDLAMMGADGTGYLVLGEGGLTAIDITTGAARWTQPVPYSHSSESPVAEALDGGGAVLRDGGTLRVVDGTGAVVSTVTGFPGDPTTGFYPGYRYWTLGQWVPAGLGPTTMLTGPEVTTADFSFLPGQGGGLTKQNAKRMPRAAIFVTVDPLSSSPPVALDDFKRVTGQQFLGKAALRVHIRQEATADAFLGELKASDIDAVGFIGHGTRGYPDAGQAIGIKFWDKWLLAQTNPQHYPPVQPIPENYSIVATLPTSAKVVFAAACYVGPIFENLWQLTPTSPRALIVPEMINVPPSVLQVPLNRAAEAWKAVLRRMIDNTMTVQAAVTEVNNSAIIQDIQPNEPRFQLKVVGNPNVKIR